MSLHNVVDMTTIWYTYETNHGCSVVSIYFQIIIYRDLNKFWVRLHSISLNKKCTMISEINYY